MHLAYLLDHVNVHVLALHLVAHQADHQTHHLAQAAVCLHLLLVLLQVDLLQVPVVECLHLLLVLLQVVEAVLLEMNNVVVFAVVPHVLPVIIILLLEIQMILFHSHVVKHVIGQMILTV